MFRNKDTFRRAFFDRDREKWATLPFLFISGILYMGWGGMEGMYVWGEIGIERRRAE